MLLASGTQVGAQNHDTSKEGAVSELDAEIETTHKAYTEVDFIKMQEYYKQNSEVIEMMKLKSMAGNQNADIFLEFLTLPFEEAKVKHGSDVVSSVIYTFYESTSVLNTFKELNVALDVTNRAHDRTVAKTELTGEQYFQHAQFIWDEFVPESGQCEVVAGELLRAVEKLRDEAQRNANVNFHDGCHTRLINYLRAKLDDSQLFDVPTRGIIQIDLDRLEQDHLPYTNDDLYDRLARRVIEWFTHYGGSLVHVNDPELRC